MFKLHTPSSSLMCTLAGSQNCPIGTAACTSGISVSQKLKFSLIKIQW